MSRYLRPAVAVLLYSSLSVAMLVGCSDSRSMKQIEPQPHVQILDDKVILDTGLIHTSNPERYQPSYNLHGRLAPINQATISTIATAQNIKFLVKTGDWVEQDDILFTVQVQLDESGNPPILPEFAEVVDDPNALDSATSTDTENSKSNDNTANKPDSESSLQPLTEVISRVGNTAQGVLQDAEESAEINGKVSATDQTGGVLEYIEELNDPKVTYQSSNKSTTGSEMKTNETPISPASAAAADTTVSSTLKPTLKPMSKKATKLVTVRFLSPIEGEVIKINPPLNLGGRLDTDQVLVKIADTRQLQLVGKLPLETQSQLSVGQSVNFKIFDTNTEFTGQISHVVVHPEKDYLVVRAPVIPSVENKSVLEYGMQAAMVINYGNIELAVRLPKAAIHGTNLDSLTVKYPRPASALHGYVWVITQAETLALTPVKIVKYFPESGQYLVDGISNDSLVVLADLPQSVDNMLVELQ